MWSYWSSEPVDTFRGAKIKLIQGSLSVCYSEESWTRARVEGADELTACEQPDRRAAEKEFLERRERTRKLARQSCVYISNRGPTNVESDQDKKRIIIRIDHEW